jgi:hypothetical protein
MSVEVLGRRWLNSRSLPLDHATENWPDESRQADWLFDMGVYESSPSQGATSYPAGGAAGNANAAGMNADTAGGAANIATAPARLAALEDAHSEGIDRLRSCHVDQGQRRPSRI